jgi:hypothetical protein
MTEILVELDERRRLSLGKVGKPEHRRYLVHEEPNGTIVLVPAVVMSESQAQLLANRDLVEQIERTVTDPSTRVRRPRRPHPSERAFTTFRDADDVTEELLDIVRSVVRCHYQPGTGCMNMVDVADRIEDHVLDNGTHPDLGNDMTSPVMRRIKDVALRTRRDLMGSGEPVWSSSDHR